MYSVVCGDKILCSQRFTFIKYIILIPGKITEGDIQRVANRMLRSKPSIAAYGSLDQLPKFSDLEAGLNSKDGRMPRRFLLFR